MQETALQIRHHDRCVHGKLKLPEAEGQHPLIIFSHGYNGSMDDFDKSAEFFAMQGFAAVTIAFCGGSVSDPSDYPSTSLSVLTMKEDLIAVIDDVSSRDMIDPNRIFLFGGSQGGLVSALTAAQLQSRITGLILLYPALCIEDNWLEKFPNIDDMPESFDFWNLMLGRKYARDIRDLNTFDRITEYTGPVMIMHGTDDAIVPHSYSVRAQSMYQNARLVSFAHEQHGFSEENNRRVDGITYLFTEEVLGRC